MLREKNGKFSAEKLLLQFSASINNYNYDDNVFFFLNEIFTLKKYFEIRLCTVFRKFEYFSRIFAWNTGEKVRAV